MKILLKKGKNHVDVYTTEGWVTYKAPDSADYSRALLFTDREAVANPVQLPYTYVHYNCYRTLKELKDV